MVIRGMKFTPEVLLSAPRRSAGVPNPSGTTVLYSLSSYNFSTHKKAVVVQLLDVATGKSQVVAEDGNLSDFTWLDDESFVCLQAEKDGTTKVCVMSVVVAGNTRISIDPHKTGAIQAVASNLKITPIPGTKDVAIVVSAPTGPDGSLWTPEQVKKKTQSTGRLYSSLYVRHWDQWKGKEKNSLWYGKLSHGSDGKHTLSELHNALKNTGLECPVPPFGGGDHFDVGRQGIIFVAKDPQLNPALNTKCNVYILKISSWTGEEEPQLEKIPVDDFHGAASSPVWKPNGNGAAFLMMKAAGYEADQNAIFVMQDIQTDSTKSVVRKLEAGIAPASSKDGFWSRSPGAIAFSADSESILATAEDTGRGKLFEIGLDNVVEVRKLTDTGYTGDFKPLSDGRVFVSGSSIVESSWYKIVDARQKGGVTPEVWSHSHLASRNGLGLDAKQVSTIWTPASNTKINKEVQSIVVKPSTFEPGKKYPVAYLIHGGPQGSWADSWSTRWNPAVFAEQGYIVVAPNPTGSTGYGQQFCDAIRGNWGGDPYQDIVNCFEWVGKNMPEADNDNAVALGASYGGYMMNWIQGHDLGRKFKALVCHDGITTFAGGMLATEELYFPFHDLGGTPWYDPGFSAAGKEAKNNFGSSTLSDWKKWDPSEHFDQWATPELVIHSELDYRLTISEALTAFNVLQARGVESEFLTFPDENHWVLKPENSLVWHKVVLNWINKHVGLPPYTKDDPDNEEFWGGVREAKEDLAELPGAGKPET